MPRRNTADHYRRNFLSDVIFKIDFPPILDLAENPPSAFQDKIISDYPKLEPIKHFGIEIQQQQKNISTQEVNKTTWRFKSADEKILVDLEVASLAIVSKSYVDFTSFNNIVTKLLDNFFEIYPHIIISRLGIRYINQISLDEENPYDWSSYINPNLIQHLDFIDEKDKIRRTMQSIDLSLDPDTILKLTYGIFNKLYPAQLNKKEFILDYDCFTRIPLDKTRIIEKAREFNEIITEYFKKSITPQLEEILNNE